MFSLKRVHRQISFQLFGTGLTAYISHTGTLSDQNQASWFRDLSIQQYLKEQISPWRCCKCCAVNAAHAGHPELTSECVSCLAAPQWIPYCCSHCADSSVGSSVWHFQYYPIQKQINLVNLDIMCISKYLYFLKMDCKKASAAVQHCSFPSD